MPDTSISSDSEPSYRRLFRVAFIGGNLHRIFELEKGIYDAEERGELRLHVDWEIDLARRRAALKHCDDHRIGTAELWLKQDRENRVAGISVGERFRGYQHRVAYLWAAQSTLPQLLTFDREIFESLASELPDPQQFRLFCMRVRGDRDTPGR